MGGFSRSGVLRAQAQDAGDQHPERALVSFRHESNNRRLPFGNFPAQNANDGMNVAVSHGAGLFKGDWLNWKCFISQIVSRLKLLFR